VCSSESQTHLIDPQEYTSFVKVFYEARKITGRIDLVIGCFTIEVHDEAVATDGESISATGPQLES
jgi:hypothetical protein